MKATGIVRRIDDLGRVVVPKEIRRTMRIREGEPMEIFTGREGEIVLKKYSPIGELGAVAKEYAQAMAQEMSGCLVCISDHDQIVAASGPEQKEYQGKVISPELEQMIMNRESICTDKKDKAIRVTPEQSREECSQLVQPIICAGDAIGAVIMMGKKEGVKLGEAEKKLVAVAAGFLGKQMEE